MQGKLPKVIGVLCPYAFKFNNEATKYSKRVRNSLFCRKAFLVCFISCLWLLSLNILSLFVLGNCIKKIIIRIAYFRPRLIFFSGKTKLQKLFKSAITTAIHYLSQYFTAFCENPLK